MVDGHAVNWHTNLHQSNHSYTLLKYILQANINLFYILELCPFEKKYFTNDFITVPATSFKRWQDEAYIIDQTQKKRVVQIYTVQQM